MYGVVYLLINTITNKVYIGQTTNFNSRMKSYEYSKKQQYKIHYSIRKHGWNNFEKHIIDISTNQDELNMLEQFYIDKFKSVDFGYNLTLGGLAGKWSEHAKTLFKTKVARKYGYDNPMFGKTHTEAARRLMSEARQGKSCPWLLGKPLSREHRKKLSDAQKKVRRKPHSDSTKQKIKNTRLANNPKFTTRIICNETGMIFESIRSCSLIMKIDYGNLKTHLKKMRRAKTVKGYTFRVYDEKE